jgi:hypothetical protein
VGPAPTLNDESDYKIHQNYPPKRFLNQNHSTSQENRVPLRAVDHGNGSRDAPPRQFTIMSSTWVQPSRRRNKLHQRTQTPLKEPALNSKLAWYLDDVLGRGVTLKKTKTCKPRGVEALASC